MLVVVFALVAAAPRAIEIDFPQELTLTIAQRVALKARAVGGPLPLAAWASFGRIEGWHAVAPDAYEGEWVSPDPVHPGDLQLVVSALPSYSAQTTAVSAVIALPGRSEPDAQVELLVAGETYGPVRTGADGKFTVPITVPPNVPTAVVRSKDKLGNVFKKTVDLFVPKVPKAALACPASRVVAGSAPLPVQLVNGPRKRVMFEPPTRSGHVDFAVGDASCAFDVVADKAADARIVFDPPYIASQSTMRVFVLDRFGNSTEASLATDVGLPVRVQDHYELVVPALAGVDQRKITVTIADFKREVTVEQVPDRGVRLTAKRTGDTFVVNVLPASEPVQATDARGLSLPLVSESTGVFRGKVSDAQEFVLVTHAASGTSVLLRLVK